MKPSQLSACVAFAIQNKYPVLIKGAPGIGKTDIVKQACAKSGADLIIAHPVVSDPTDFKGLPYPLRDKDEATFLPFGDLLRIIKADKPTVFFLDDLGQAPASVQAACMQLILARRINGHVVSDTVTFIAATNRREDKAGVMGILEPVKSRFSTILELNADLDDWIAWAIANDMPHELISFIRFRPGMLHDFKPTADIVNTPSPRTISSVGKMLNSGLPTGNDKNDTSAIKYQIIAGAAGEAFAVEFLAYLDTYKNLPDIDAIIAKPDEHTPSTNPAILYAVCGALAYKANATNFDSIMVYANKMTKEFETLLVKDSKHRNIDITNTASFSKWAVDNKDWLFQS